MRTDIKVGDTVKSEEPEYFVGKIVFMDGRNAVLEDPTRPGTKVWRHLTKLELYTED